MIQTLFKQVAVTIIAITISSQLWAGSPTGNVGTAKVDKGVLSLEQRFGFSWDDPDSSNDQRFRMRQHVDYGFTDWYAFRLLLSQDKRKGDNIEHSTFTLENRFQLIERRDHGWHGGVRLLYAHSDGDKTPHEIDFRLMAQIPFGANKKWESRHNVIFEHDIGENSESGLMIELRNQVTKAVTPPSYLKKLQFGVEMFNDLGRIRESSGIHSQNHQLGPLLKATFKNGAFIQTGYRLGVSDDGTDHLVKFFIGKKF